jgi:hypothetical protein
VRIVRRQSPSPLEQVDGLLETPLAKPRLRREVEDGGMFHPIGKCLERHPARRMKALRPKSGVKLLQPLLVGRRVFGGDAVLHEANLFRPSAAASTCRSLTDG